MTYNTYKKLLNHLSDLLHTEIRDETFTLSDDICLTPISTGIVITVYNEQDKTTILNELRKSDKLLISEVNMSISNNNTTYICTENITNLSNLTI